MLSSVLLPLPDAPTSAMNSPLSNRGRASDHAVAGHERAQPVPVQPVVGIGATEVSPGRRLGKSQCRTDERLGQRALGSLELLVCIDILSPPRRKLAIFSGTFFGLIVGASSRRPNARPL